MSEDSDGGGAGKGVTRGAVLLSLRLLRSLRSRKKAGRDAVAGVGDVTVTTGALGAVGSGETRTRAGRWAARRSVLAEKEEGGFEKEKNGSPSVEYSGGGERGVGSEVKGARGEVKERELEGAGAEEGEGEGEGFRGEVGSSVSM